MTTVITRRNIPAAYDALIRTVWWNGKKKTDQRNNTVSELRSVMVEVMQPDITYPDFGPTSKLFGDEFAKGLIDPDIAEEMAFKFDYSYGGRIHGLDALSNCIEMLKLDSDTRRAVLTIYNRADLADSLTGKEVPCATQIYLGIDDGKLTMTLMMRSNDVVGAFPSDAYGFRRLQEYIAEQVGVEMGAYRHYIENAHIIHENDAQWVEQHVRTPQRWY